MNIDRTRRLRFAIPVVILAGAAGILGWLWLRPNVPMDSKAPNTFFLIAFVVPLLWLWTATMSGLRRVVRVPVIALGVLAGGAFLWLFITGHLIFDGNLVPMLRSPFEGHTASVEEHRSNQGPPPESPIEVSDRPTDWPEFRGPRRDGVVARGPKLSRDWKARPPRQVWKQPCGEGWGSFAISGNLVVTLEQRGGNEAVVAYDAATGHERWKHEYKARFWEPLGGLGPRSTPTISGGNVYSLGAAGDLTCLNARTGERIWHANILGGGDNLKWGMAGSPLVVDGKVIVNPGGQSSSVGTAVVAYGRATPEIEWATKGTKAAYSSPMLATLADQRQIVLFDATQVAGYDLANGHQLWTHPWRETMQDINVSQPLVLNGDRVFVSSGYSIGCAMLKIERSDGGWNVKELWRNVNKPLRCKFSNPVEYQGHIYGLDESILACIDVADGSEKWRDGRYGHGQLLRWEDLLIVLDERGNLVLVEAMPTAHRELGRVKAIKAERTWNVPAMVDGRVFIRNDREMACFDLRE